MLRTLFFTLNIYWIINTRVISASNPIGLKASASLRGLLLGTAADVTYLRRDFDAGQYASTIKTNYQLMVPEIEMKPQHLWWGDNIYNFTDPDWLLGDTPNSTGWIQQNGMLLRGHNLLWAGDQHMPAWLIQQESSITPDKAKSLMSDYIHTVVGRYRGKVAWWDVVNEAIEADYKNTSNPFNLRNCFWFRKLGADFMKYAFIFAHEADPDVKLYYNDYNIESVGLKGNRTLDLIRWLKSENVPIHGIGMQWHIMVSTNVTPGDGYYQNAQQFVDLGLDFMVTELDISIPMNGTKPLNSSDVEKQGLVYRSLLQYVLHFFPRCQAMLTWGFTDRYSWIPSASNYTRGDALPLDSSYQPKPAYLQMQEELARVLTDGVYCLSPQSQPDKYLGVSEDGTTVKLDSEKCDNVNERWNITWLGDGTYRLSPMSNTNRALYINNATATVGEVQMSNWSDNFSQEWVFTSEGNNTFRVGPRNAWSRVLTVYETTNIDVIDYRSGSAQNWILTSV
jgi:endo-1,4-beta-xylanase